MKKTKKNQRQPYLNQRDRINRGLLSKKSRPKKEEERRREIGLFSVVFVFYIFGIFNFLILVFLYIYIYLFRADGVLFGPLTLYLILFWSFYYYFFKCHLYNSLFMYSWARYNTNIHWKVITIHTNHTLSLSMLSKSLLIIFYFIGWQFN